jgi:DNA-binding transcriptional regulator GbsR (MarR family)
VIQLPTFVALAEITQSSRGSRHKEIVELVPFSKGRVSQHLQTLKDEDLVKESESGNYMIDKDALWNCFTTFFDENLRQDENPSLPNLNQVRRHITGKEDEYYGKLRDHFEQYLLGTLANARQKPRIQTLRDVFRDVERSIHDYAWLNADDTELLALSLTTYQEPPYETNEEATKAMQRVKEELL